jgi:hypothetical protein
MSTCTTCYGTNTAQPCASVGCLSTNYGKCITYSGSNLFCQKGSIATFTFTGTAVSPTINTTVVASVTGGNGTDATFSVLRTAGQTTYEVTLVNQGSNYEVSDVLTIPGTSLGGTSPLNDITITVTTLAAVISNGDNLDTVISNLNNRLCLVSSSSPSGLDYTAFNYACLRVGGNLEGVGTVITTAKQFTEAVAAALCSLNVRVKDLEKPQIIVNNYFGGDLTGGVSTLVQILNKYGEAIGDLNNKFTINSPHTCAAFTHLTTLTTKPSSTASLGTWFDWVSTNLCNNFTILDAKITEQINEHTLINTFLYGVNQPYPLSRGNNFVNTLCLPGGVAQSNVRSAVNLIVTELCSLKTIVTNAATQNYTITTGCLSTPYTANSVFGVQGLGTLLQTTTLQGHLQQIYNALSDLNLSFDSSQFTLFPGTCGPVVSLISGTGTGAVTCAAVEANVNLDCLKDAYYPTPPLTGNILFRDNGTPTQWINGNLRVLTYTTNGVDTSFGVHNTNGSAPDTLDLPISFPKTRKEPLAINPNTQPSLGWLIQPAGIGSGTFNYPVLIKDDVTGVVRFYGETGFRLNNNTLSPITLTHNLEIPIFMITLYDFLPDIAPNNGKNQLTTITGIRQDQASSGPGTFIDTRTFVLKVYSQNNAVSTFPGYINAISVVYQGPTLNVAAGHFIDFYVGGISWPTI